MPLYPLIFAVLLLAGCTPEYETDAEGRMSLTHAKVDPRDDIEPVKEETVRRAERVCADMGGLTLHVLDQKSEHSSMTALPGIRIIFRCE